MSTWKAAPHELRDAELNRATIAVAGNNAIAQEQFKVRPSGLTYVPEHTNVFAYPGLRQVMTYYRWLTGDGSAVDAFTYVGMILVIAPGGGWKIHSAGWKVKGNSGSHDTLGPLTGVQGSRTWAAIHTAATPFPLFTRLPILVEPLRGRVVVREYAQHENLRQWSVACLRPRATLDRDGWKAVTNPDGEKTYRFNGLEEYAFAQARANTWLHHYREGYNRVRSFRNLRIESHPAASVSFV